MRFVLVAVLGFALVTAGIFMPWGDKQVTRGACTQNASGFDVVSSCDMSSVDARYWSGHLRADLRFWQTEDGQVVSSTSFVRQENDYRMAGSELEGNAGLFWASPMLWFSVGLAATALPMLAVTRKRHDGARWGAVALWLGAGGMLVFGGLLGIGGMLIHSATWAGSSVSSLTPRIGAFFITGGTFLGGYGVVRSGQAWVLKLRGIDANSPLAPILELAPEPEEERKKRVKREKPKLVWSRDILIPIVAAALLGGAAAAPLAHKDMTFYDCIQRGNEWTCERFETTATYRTYGVTFTGRNGTDDIDFHDRTRNFDGPLSSGSFSDHHPVPDRIGWAYPAWLGGSILLGLAGPVQPWRSRWPNVLVVNITWILASLGLVGYGASLLLRQSLQWPGQPAGHLRPALGLVLVVLALAFVVRLIWRSRWVRPPVKRRAGWNRSRRALQAQSAARPASGHGADTPTDPPGPTQPEASDPEQASQA